MREVDLFIGAHVRLGPMVPEAAGQLARWSQSSTYLRHLDSDIAVPLTISQVEKRMEATDNSPGTFEFLIHTLEDDQPIGFVALHSIEWNNRCGLVAIGIGEPGCRRKGFAKEALGILLRYAFCELNLNRVGLDVIAYNTPALKLYESVGFQREGAMRSAVLRDGEVFDRVIMGILQTEWEAIQEASDD